MTWIVAILVLSLAGLPATANVGPAFLPDFTFPDPGPQPDISTQGCTTRTTTCR